MITPLTIILITVIVVMFMIIVNKNNHYVSKKQIEGILNQLNKRVHFFDEIDQALITTIDYDKNNLTNYHYDILSEYIKKNEKNFELLMNHLNLKIESGDRINKIK